MIFPREVLACPLPACEWHETMPNEVGVDVLQQARRLEEGLRAHFETHSLEDWLAGLRETVRRRDALWHKAVSDLCTRATADGVSRLVQLQAATEVVRDVVGD